MRLAITFNSCKTNMILNIDLARGHLDTGLEREPNNQSDGLIVIT